MGNKRIVYRIGIVLGLVLATIGAYAWSVTGTHAQSAEALRYDRDRGCATRPLSALRRAPAATSPCHVERLAVERRDVQANTEQADPSAAKSSGYIVTFASGPSRIRAALAVAPSPALWETIQPGAQLDVQFFEEKISGFEAGGRFVATVGDPAVEPSEHAVGVAFIPLAFLYLFGVIAYFALGPKGRPAPKSGAKRGSKKPPGAGVKPAAKAAKR
jgi:hypothetical protein